MDKFHEKVELFDTPKEKKIIPNCSILSGHESVHAFYRKFEMVIAICMVKGTTKIFA